jgi:Flp pilus assembly pilin Flp
MMTMGLTKRLRDKKGQGMVEYILILGLIALICFAVVKALGTNVQTAFQTAATDTSQLN